MRILFLLLVLSLCACSGLASALQHQTDPRYHPFDTYDSGGGGSR
jgi:hypothetical protein